MDFQMDAVPLTFVIATEWPSDETRFLVLVQEHLMILATKSLAIAILFAI